MEISIVFRQTKKNIIETVNASGLPYDMVVYALKEVLKEAEEQAEKNYQSELKKEIERIQQEKARAEEMARLEEEAKQKETKMKQQDQDTEDGSGKKVKRGKG